MAPRIGLICVGGLLLMTSVAGSGGALHYHDPDAQCRDYEDIHMPWIPIFMDYPPIIQVREDGLHFYSDTNGDGKVQRGGSNEFFSDNCEDDDSHHEDRYDGHFPWPWYCPDHGCICSDVNDEETCVIGRQSVENTQPTTSILLP